MVTNVTALNATSWGSCDVALGAWLFFLMSYATPKIPVDLHRCLDIDLQITFQNCQTKRILQVVIQYIPRFLFLKEECKL